MKKLLIPFGVLAALGLIFTIMCYLSFAMHKDKSVLQSEDEKATVHTYEMPKFIPAVWVHGH